ncbi:hypothetical protein [Streptococcus suis]|uniref:hypothetical protein n=1 Tax=Streptococcus suis TaxID=1307 RepID=UPI000CF4F539
MEELKIRDKVEINHPLLEKPLIGVIFNINDFRPPEAKYAVDVDGFDGCLFLGREHLTKI